MGIRSFPALFFLFSLLGFSQGVDRTKDVYLDSKDNVITQKEFRNQWSNHARWDYINKEGNRTNTLNDTVFITLQAEYEILRNKIESIANLNIQPNSTILIEYFFLNDLCTSSKPENNWNKSRIRERKKFLKSYKKKLEKDSNVFIIFLFEEGIKLDTDPSKESEYFYTDENNFFRNNIFIQPTLCGSFAAIKPNGNVLVRNGENRIDLFAKYLKDENWNVFFSESSVD